MKKILTMVLALIMVLCMATGVASAEDPLKIGICVMSWNSNPIFIDAGAKLRAIAEENGYELYEKELTTDTVITSLETFISAGCDIILVQANQAPDAVASMMDRFAEAGITLAIYDSDAFVDYDCVAYSATCDNYTAGYELGKAAAKWVNENMEGPIHAGVINRESNETFRFRGVGIEDALNEYLKDGEVGASFESVPGTAEGGLKAAEDLMSAVPNMNLCVAWNGGSGVGAYEALKASNYEGVLFTCDASQDEIKALMEGKFMIGSLDLDLGNQFVQLFTKAVEYVQNGREYPEGTTDEDKLWYYPTTLITQEMAPDYLLG